MEFKIEIEPSEYHIKKEQKFKLPWVEKYRPDSLDKVISHKHIIETMKKSIKNKNFTHLLFYGPPGTGKTSTIMACVRELYGDQYKQMVMELNASDDRGIECVREKIKGFVSSGNFFNNNDDKMFKIVILDEMDNLTYDAQAGLRKMIEDNTSNARFCLICNYTKNIDPALLSRCSKYRFSPLEFNDMVGKAIEVVKKEKVKYTKKGIETVIKRSAGDMRIVLNSLQIISMGYDIVNTDTVNKCLGYPQEKTLIEIIKICINDKMSVAYSKIDKIKKEVGMALRDLINEISEIIINQILCSSYDCFDGYTEDKYASLLVKLSNIQYYLTDSDEEDIHQAAMIGALANP